MTSEQALEAIGRGMMQALLKQDVVAPRRRTSSAPRRGTEPRAAAGTTPAADTPPPMQRSMFEPPDASLPSIEDLDKILGINREPDPNPPNTYIPENGAKPWMAR